MGEQTTKSLLRVEAIEAGYGDVQILWGISLTAAAGAVTTLVGTNGAGKTTTLRAVMGSIAARKGRVEFAGEDVTGLSPHEKTARGLVLVPEGRQLFADMSVEENLEMGAFSKRARQRFVERLEQVYALFPRLKERRRQKAGTFSGGEQQMLAIGRGLMSDPELLIIDELSLGLAPVMVQLVVEKLAALKKTGLAILLVEQNVHLALALSDYAYVIAEGRPFAEGASAKIAAMPEIRQAYLGL
jgi:branched-chain amino acid transport system ATP-binding protein